jgi:Na+/H+ antiporter NhaD/arsenite permease-like protein
MPTEASPLSALGFTLLLLAVLVLQARWPAYRLQLVLGGAAMSCLVAALSGLTSLSQVLASVPWNVLVILVALGLFTQRLAATRLFGRAALLLVRVTGARPMPLLILSTIGMYVTSSLANNLTALLVTLPVLLSVFTLAGISQRYLSWTLGLMLVACNLGGAATPIGDFPAVLLLASGNMDFLPYLRAALPPTLLALALMLVLASLLRPARDVPTSTLSRRLTVATLDQLYRSWRLDWPLLWPCLAVLSAMLLAWSLLELDPALIAWIGASVVLVLRPQAGEAALRSQVDVEALLFLLGLFVMVGVVRELGMFSALAQWLQGVPLSPVAQLLLFLVVAALVTGLFSAGPAMAALLEVAEQLARQFPPDTVYIGLALSVCAGSSLFLTAATAGPLMQTLAERARLQGAYCEYLQFGFREYLRIGLLGFGVTLAVGLGRTLWVLQG